MSATAVDHDVDLDDQTRAELQPRCEVDYPYVCSEPARWVAHIATRCVHPGGKSLLCEEHGREFETATLVLCRTCGAPRSVMLERL